MKRVGFSSRRSLQAIKEIDAFPKVAESYQQTSAYGGGISLLVFTLIAVLVVFEIRYYTATELKFEYAVDVDSSAKLKINIDITVAMPCSTIGSDILDMTGQTTHSMLGELAEEDVYFELSPRQRDFFRMMQNVNGYIKEEYHAVHDILWNTGFGDMYRSMPAREDLRTGKKDACRIHGTVNVNKVAGNFHITVGKIKVQGFGGESHAHLALGVKENEYNFTHRIAQFSFGDHVSGIVNPLDGEERVTYDNKHMFQYFMQVVPTEVQSGWSTVDSYQYAVTERNRTISHSAGSHGVPGIFVKYDLSGLKVKVRQEHKPYWQFLVHMCGIVGGVFATSGILHSLCGLVVDAICCRLKICETTSHPPATTLPASNLLQSAPATNTSAEHVPFLQQQTVAS